jgi:hypothetical protein
MTTSSRGLDLHIAVSRRRVAGAALLLAVTGVFAIWITSAPATFAQSQNRQPVLVELFTSEGCSSCPPADALLIELDKKQTVPGVEVVALGHHVDYWNGAGWNDRFSSHEASVRQQRYTSQLRLQSPYTPQLVVDGHLDVVGNDRREVQRTIVEAARSAKPATVALTAASPDALRVDVGGSPTSAADVMLAITESDLSTSVGGGENGGRELRHTAVVRVLQRLGSTKDGRFSATVPISYRQGWNRQHLRAVIFVQQGAGPILGVGMVALNGKL